MGDRSYEAAREARRASDPDWRRYMPIRWHLSRWWDIYWPAVVSAGLLVVVCIVLLAVWRG